MVGVVDETADIDAQIPDLLSERIGPVVRLTLNRPDKGNSLTLGLRRSLAQSLNMLDRDASVRAIILIGSGDSAFCTGLDLDEVKSGFDVLADAYSGDADLDPILALRACSKPVIAAVNGKALTGGFELALNCDLIVVSEGAEFADTHLRVGLLPAWGISQILPRKIGMARAQLVLLAGRSIPARDAVDWGLAAYSVPAGDLAEETLQLASRMAKPDPSTFQAMWDLLHKGAGLGLSEALSCELAHSAPWNETRLG